MPMEENYRQEGESRKEEIAEHVCKRHNQMKGVRGQWETLWQEIADYVIPNHDNVTKKSNEGEKKGQKLFTSISVNANDTLASAMHGMLVNPADVWFGMSSGMASLDERKEIKEWLQLVVEVLLGMLNNSNFNSEVHQYFLHLGSFGTAILRVEEDDDTDVNFQSRPVAEVYIDENHKGLVDTVSYEYRRSLRKIVQEFGEDVLPEELKKEYDENSEKEYTVIHFVTPRSDIKLGKLNKTNKKFASYHVLEQGKILLKESGFDENPYIIGRWSKVPGETYGRSPAMKCLADIKMVNEMSKAVIVGAQKTINPPVQVPDDGVLLPVRLVPGGVNFYRAGTKDRIEPLITGARPDIGEQLIRDVEEKIKQAFFIDQLQIRMADRMTATEVMQRRDEQLRLLGPILGRQEFEFLKPLITRLYGIAEKKGLIPEPPSVINKKNIKVKYTSQLARIQRTSELDNLTKVFNLISPLAQAKPEMLDNFNGDGIVRTLADKFSLPASYSKSEDEVSQFRQAKAQQAQQQMDLQNQANQLDVAAKANQLGM